MISAPPGTGKSTRVPPFLLDKLQPKKSIVVAQPRRLAATTLASWVAKNRDTNVGKEVGYSVRFDRKVSADTMIEFVTDGLLVRRLAGDPTLKKHEIVILDEFHERSLNTDLCAAFVRDLMSIRDDLKVVVMSATISANEVADYFDAPIVDVQVPQFPNEIEYLQKLPEHRADAVAKLIRQVIKDDPPHPSETVHEDILAFLPGKRDIEDVRQRVKDTHADVRVLHGSLTLPEQRKVLAPSDRRRVILATNIAETSLTVPGVRIVVDSGMEKIDRVDPHTGFDHLEERPISFASADQRAGRAAREGAGKTYRAWTKNFEFRMDQFRPSAIARSDITGAVLQVAKWTDDLENFRWFEAPKASTLTIALKMLNAIGAIDDQNKITPFGEKLVDLPLPPRLAALVYHARHEGFAREGAYAAAVLSEPEFELANKPDKVIKCDISVRASQIAETGFPKNAFRVAGQIEKECRTKGPINEKVIRELLLKTFPDLFSIKRSPTRYALVTGGSAFIRPREKDRSDYAIVLRAFGTKKVEGVSCSVANYVCEIDKKMFKDAVEKNVVPIFSEKDKRVDIFEVESFHGLELKRTRTATDRADPLEVAQLFAKNVARDWKKAFTITDDVTQLIARMNLLEPENNFEDRMNDIEFICALVGTDRSFKATKKINLHETFMETIPDETRERLKAEVPAAFETPAGKFRAIDYTVSPPVLAIRIQEMFSLSTTPTINDGKVRLRLHLLAPNSKPVEITEDLENFWDTTYSEARADLMAQYPKHNWPKNPANAQPQAK